MDEYIECPICLGLFALEGTDGLFPHLIAFHSETELGQRVIREIVHMRLPEAVER